ncbi:MAG: 3-phosphoshikimate 1-carboxyvinyltransferase [Flavobacteriaceae bacterium]|nr:3-phosphoshikimate 1-carboxyvinyltransferase [Flavobacteriaceae bacterium]
MTIKLQKSILKKNSNIRITGSKSESNRLLILKALHNTVELENLSNSDDTQVMLKALESKERTVDIHHAGTAMRFLTAYFSSLEGRETGLTGSSRMKQRPISILVDALRDLGASIQYIENEGYPPIKISGKKITNNKVTLAANVSSQYISALLLIGSKLENGLELHLEGEITSVPYIQMTLELLSRIGVKSRFEGNVIEVFSGNDLNIHKLIVESDWSSASYFYSLAALSEVDTSITLSAYRQDSLQGDSCLAEIYKQFGVETEFNNNEITLTKKYHIVPEKIIELNLVNAPDIAQTIAVTCFGLGISCDLSGLHTLKIKETDRLVALKVELEKLGASVTITNSELFLKKSNSIQPNVSIDTYQDHRMAMAFAPLVLSTSLAINEANVVSKSFPDFWDNMKTLGIEIKK